MTTDIQPKQQVLLDGAVTVDFVSEAPNSPGMVIVESWSTGPIVVSCDRIELVS